jgi:PhzF family phenazine biosynthesis protein
MFCPALGIAEDPVSGNAHALLAAQLCAVGRMPERSGTREFTARQGHHMGRPGTLSVRVSAASSGGERVRVAGRARIVFEATLDA